MQDFDFDRDVLDRSRAVPVVVDFWAAWCGPCRILGPILEQLVSEADGRWELVKVDTEAHPQLAQAFGIRSIPAVKLFRDGAVAGEFVGALPASEVRRWLDAYLPDPRGEGLEALAAQWPERGGAIADELEALVDERPDLEAARLYLAQALVARDPARARELVQSVNADADLIDLASDVRALADLMDSRETAPTKLAPVLDAAREALRRHDLRETLERLVEAAGIDRAFADELPRRAAVALFRMLGHNHELTDEYRGRLAQVLYS